MEIRFSNKNTGFYQPLKSVGELSTLTLDKNISLIEQISNELGVQAIYFEGGTLVVDDYSGQNNRDGIYKLTSTLEENKKPTRRVLVAKAADIKAYKSEKVTSVDTGVGEYDQEKTLLQFQDLMQKVYELGAEDVYITLSKSADTAYALFKVDGRLLSLTYPLKNYAFGRAMCAAVYDGLGGVGATIGTFDEVTTPQEKGFKYPLYDTRGALLAKFSVRYTKTKTSRSGELMVNLRIQKKARKIGELGLPQNELELLERKSSKAQGAIITAGRTGSGKTTTNFAVLLNLPKDKSYQTFEDPIEIEKPYEYVNIHQNSMDLKIGIDAQLKSIMRQAPDGVFIQEIRDPLTAKFAMDVCNTGLLAISSTHAPSAIGIPKRLNDLGVTFADMSTPQGLSLLNYLALVRLLCTRCKVPLEEAKTVFPEEYNKRKQFFKDVAVDEDELQGIYLRSPQGCSHCHYSGEDGRKLLVEMIDVQSQDRKFIHDQKWDEWHKYLKLEKGYLPVSEKVLFELREGRVDVDRAAELRLGE